MEIICRGRGGGKTVLAILEAARNRYTIVCYSANEVKRVQKMAEEFGVKIPQPITFNDFINGKEIKTGINGFVIDNADALLQRMAGGKPIRAITATYEPNKSPYETESAFIGEVIHWDPKRKRSMLYGEWGNDDETQDNS